MNIIEGWHYQNAYVCDDIEAAIAQFRTHTGIGEVAVHDIDQMIGRRMQHRGGRHGHMRQHH